MKIIGTFGMGRKKLLVNNGFFNVLHSVDMEIDQPNLASASGVVLWGRVGKINEDEICQTAQGIVVKDFIANSGVTWSSQTF